MPLQIIVQADTGLKGTPGRHDTIFCNIITDWLVKKRSAITDIVSAIVYAGDFKIFV